MNSHELFESQVTGYVLEALEADEEKVFEEHLLTCKICQQAVSEYRETASALGDTVESVRPSSNLRGRIMAIARSDLSVNGATRTALWKTNEAKRIKLPFDRKVMASAVAAMLLAIAGLSLLVFSLKHQANQDSSLISRSYTALSIMAQASQRWEVSGTSLAPGAHGVLAYSREENAASLIVWGLPYEHGEHYRVWTSEGGVRATIGTMWAEDEGLWIVIPDDLSRVDAVGITLIQSGAGTSPSNVVDVNLSGQ